MYFILKDRHNKRLYFSKTIWMTYKTDFLQFWRYTKNKILIIIFEINEAYFLQRIIRSLKGIMSTQCLMVNYSTRVIAVDIYQTVVGNQEVTLDEDWYRDINVDISNVSLNQIPPIFKFNVILHFHKKDSINRICNLQ
jgi:hypothetical protein